MRFSIDRSKNFRTIYKYNFSNLTDVHNYLITDPPVNCDIFRTQASINGTEKLAGANLSKSIDYLRGGYKFNFDKFDIAVNDLRRLGYQDNDSRKLERCIHGGSYLSPLVAAGVPDCMVRYCKDTEPKHITIYFQLAYPHYTSAEQVFNRGVAAINLVQLLEEKGYLVDLKVFELSKCIDEYVEITVNIKKSDEFLNISKCYYPLVGKEFLRRLLFRILESAPVTEDWGRGYGRAATSEEIREFYRLRKKDLVIPAPDEVEIQGKDMYTDMIHFLTALNLESEFDLSKIKKKVKTRV